MEKRELNETENGLTYDGRAYMVAGWLSDYELTFDADILNEVGAKDKNKKTVDDFKENRGYVDDDGYIHIFRKEPNPKEKIPWFSITVGDDGKPRLVFNPNRNKLIEEAFHLNRVADLSIKHILESTKPGPAEYDEQVIADIMRSTSNYIPEIKEEDDFLKRLIKTIILEKEVNVHKYKSKMTHSYQLSNLISGLSGKTKTSPFTYENWMDILDVDFQIVVTDQGIDPDNPLPNKVIYDSRTDAVYIGEVDTSKKEGPRTVKKRNG